MNDQNILKCIVSDEERLTYYFKNNFNEDIHKEEKYEKYLQQIRELISVIFENYDREKDNKEKDDKGKDNNNRFETLFEKLNGCLRYIKFMHEMGE